MAQRTQIENLKIDLSEQERMTQDQQNVAARLEADQTLLRAELERAEYFKKMILIFHTFYLKLSGYRFQPGEERDGSKVTL